MISVIRLGEFTREVNHRPSAVRMRAKWCQLCRSAWSSMTNCAVTGAPKLREKGRRLIQFFIRECAYCGSRLTTVPAQEFERGSFRHLGIVPEHAWHSTRRQPPT